MFYHFLPQGIYAHQFINFMRSNKKEIFNNHVFLFLSHGEKEENVTFSANDSKNVFTFFSILKFFLCLKKNDRIIIHNYSHPYLYFASACCWWKLNNVAWLVWGGDLFFFNIVKNLKYKFYEMFRKIAIKRFAYIITYGSEYDLAKKYYNAKGKVLHFLYPMSFFKMPECQNKESIFILVGNSRSVSNEHIEALKLLAKFKDENIKVFVPLSYGECPSGYVESIDKLGTEIFGEKYIPIKTMMDLRIYQEFLATIDIMVCNHRRQEAWGTIFALLLNHKKVFVRKETPTNIDFTSFGLKFFLTDDVSSMTFDEFKYFNEVDGRSNEKILMRMFSKESLIDIWNNIFTDMLN